MSLRVTASVNTRPFDAFADALDNFNEIVFRVGSETVAERKPIIIQRLAREPGPVKRPIQWTSIRQQRAFFATNGFGNGIPTGRSGRLAAGWDVISFEDRGTFKMFIVNPNSAAKFVYGPLGAFSGKNPRQQFHANTGWIEARPIVDDEIDLFIEAFKRNFARELEGFGSVSGGSRQAFTGG